MSEYQRSIEPADLPDSPEQTHNAKWDNRQSAEHYAAMAEAFIDIYLESPPSLTNNFRGMLAKNFILCHSIELALKAFLLSNDIDVKIIYDHKIRHNINRLLSYAEDFEIQISVEERTYLRQLSLAHKQYWNRYPKPGNAILHLGDSFVLAARRIIDLTREQLEK